MPNKFLLAQRKKFDGLRTSIQEIQNRAVTEERDLTEDELRSITDFATQADAVGQQIEQIVDVENRSTAIANLAASISDAADDDGHDTGDTGQQLDGNRSADNDDRSREQTRSRRRTTTRDRDPGHYTRSSGNSFFGDLYRSKTEADDDAARRLVEHNRALSTGSQGPGVVPPHWLVEEFELLARQGRALANAVRQIDLGDDPRPMTLPKQTAGTDSVVAEQTNENDAVSGTDAWDSDVDLVTPKPTAGKQIVSRQMLDMSNPAIDQLIYGDLISVYNLKVETKVGAAVIAAAGAAVTTFATEAAFAAAGAATDSVVDVSLAVRDARKLPATLLAMTTRRWGKFKKLKDSTGRPLIPSGSAGPMNVFGIGTVQADGQIEDLPAIVTDGIGTTAYPESYVAMRASDTILFEGTTMRFRFEEQVGPESVVLGIWGYTAVIVRQSGKSVKRVVVTAA